MKYLILIMAIGLLGCTELQSEGPAVVEEEPGDIDDVFEEDEDLTPPPIPGEEPQDESGFDEVFEDSDIAPPSVPMD